MFTPKNALPQAFAFLLILLPVFGFNEQLFAKQRRPNEQEDFFEMSLEDLMEVEVISSARRPQPLVRATSAVYVITAEDIRQVGVTHLVT